MIGHRAYGSTAMCNDQANRAAAKSLETRKTTRPSAPIERLVRADPLFQRQQGHKVLPGPSRRHWAKPPFLSTCSMIANIPEVQFPIAVRHSVLASNCRSIRNCVARLNREPADGLAEEACLRVFRPTKCQRLRRGYRRSHVNAAAHDLVNRCKSQSRRIR